MTRGTQPVRPWLENKVQTELNLTRVCLTKSAGRSSLAKLRARGAGYQIREVGVIERIEEVGGKAKLELLRDGGLLIQLGVPIE